MTTGRHVMKPHAAIGMRLRKMRDRRRMSLRELAIAIRARNGGDGLGLDHSALSRIESGARQVTVEQWLLIAAALDCPPIMLIIPLGDSDDVQITAQSRIHPDLARRWISGEQPLASTDGRAIGLREWSRMRKPLVLHDRLLDRQGEVHARDPWHRPLSSEDARPWYADLAAVLVEMIEAEVTPPQLSPWTLGRLAEFGHNPDALELRPYTPEHWYLDPSDEERDGTRVTMRHPALADAVDIPTVEAPHYQSVGWRKAKSKR